MTKPNKASRDRATFNQDALQRLLRPRHIVVMGGRWAEAVIVSCLDMGFEGEIWPVHPTREDIKGVKAYPSLEALPEAPDAVFLGINRHASIDVVKELSAMGAGGVVAFASGFAEVDDGADLQDELVAAAGEMPVLGPNCYGMINYLDGALLWPDVHGGARVDRGVAIITQSSNLSINLTMQTAGLPIAYMLTLGNQAMIGMAALIDAVAADDRVTAIGLHIEGIRDADFFAEAVKRAKASGKPLVAMKAGASEGAQAMTFSHTASLAGAHHVSLAFLKRLGIGVIESVDGFLQTLSLLHLFGKVNDASILTLSCSGGEASLIADAAERHGLTMPPLSDSASAAIRATVNPLVTVSNPFDYHTFDWGDRERLTATFTAAMQADQEVSILIIDFPRQELGRAEDWQLAIEAWSDAQKTTGKIAVVLASMPELLPPHIASWLMAQGIAPLRGFDAGLTAIAAAHQASQFNAREASDYSPVGLNPIDGDVENLSERDAKQLLADAGVAVPEGIVATRLDDALLFGQDRKLVMKITTAAHKTEKDGVRLNIKGGDAIKAAWQDLAPSGPVLMEDMIDDGIAEVIIGVARDPLLGLHLVIGLGGILAELTRDTALVMMPANRDDLSDAIDSTMVAALLAGYRGKPKGDRDALIDLIMAVQEFALSHQDRLIEMDINPVMVRPVNRDSQEQRQGAVAVDALIRWAKSS